jgi:hypothetical protein
MNRVLQSIEDEILSVGERLNDVFYEKLTDGVFTGPQLNEAYRTLSKWSKASEDLLGVLNGQREQGNGRERNFSVGT